MRRKTYREGRERDREVERVREREREWGKESYIIMKYRRTEGMKITVFLLKIRHENNNIALASLNF